MGVALRDKKDPLGSLVALEMGKIKQEGDGEVQEMIILQILRLDSQECCMAKRCIQKDQIIECTNNGIH